MANLQCEAILIKVNVFFLQNPLQYNGIDATSWVRIFCFMFPDVSWVLVCLARCRMGSVDKIHICKMRLTCLHDLNDSWHLYIRRSLFGLSTLFWILTSWISDVNKPDVAILTCWMSDFYKLDVGFLQVGCRIFTSRMSDFYKLDVGF